MMNSSAIFDTYALQYDEKFNRNPLGKYQRERVHREITAYLLPGQTILDIGCGPGSDFKFYRRLNLRVHAIDSSAKMVELAKQNAALLDLDSHIRQIPLEEFHPETSYHVIILNFGVINVFHPLQPILSKLNTMLSDEGILIIVSMPPVHLFTLLEWLLTFRWRALLRRLWQHRAVLENGFQFYYYNKRAFTRHFHILKAVHLGAILPTPDQYHRYGCARRVADKLMRLDQLVASQIPDWLGGDHVCYILKRKGLE